MRKLLVRDSSHVEYDFFICLPFARYLLIAGGWRIFAPIYSLLFISIHSYSILFSISKNYECLRIKTNDNENYETLRKITKIRKYFGVAFS